MQRLDEGVVIGDGGFVFALEKRGYVKAGPWTPEAVIEHPDAVMQLHREFLRSGSDVMQAFTFYASDDKLANRGNQSSDKYTCAGVNTAACDLAHKVADEGGALVAGGLSETPTYLSGYGKEATQAEFRKQVKVFKANKVDFLIAEYFEYIEEMEWAIEVCKESGIPVVASMCIGPEGDCRGVPCGECGLRMARAGADVVGINCHFDPFVTLEGLRLMKKAMDEAGIKKHMIAQPLAFHTPDAKRQGFIDLPEFPFGLEPRICTRWDMHRYAREAYELGVRFIGGCCGFEPYHVRAIAEELVKERGITPPACEKHLPWGGGLKMHTKPWVRARAGREYWEHLKPSSGRPMCASMSTPDQWGVVAGDDALKQNKGETTQAEITQLKQRQKQEQAK